MSKAPKQQSLPNKTTKIPGKTFALLFSEVVQYCWSKSQMLDQFAKQLHSMGYPIGCSILEVYTQNQTSTKFDFPKPVNIMVFLRDKIWPYLFGYPASSLEQTLDDDNTLMLYDVKPSITQYISPPNEMRQNQYTCCSFVAGIVEGICVSAGFPCQCTAHPINEGIEEYPDRVVYLVKFVEEEA